MKILQINKLYYPWIGGVEKVVQEISEGLNTRINADNNSSEFASPDPYVSALNPRSSASVEVLVCQPKGKGEIENINDVKITRAGSIGMFFGMPVSFSFPFWLRKKAKEADILHFHSPFPLGELAYLLFCPKNKKVVVTYHSDIFRQKIFLKFYKPFLIKFLARADKILVTSPNLLEDSQFLKKFKEKCEVVPLFIDIDKFNSRKAKKVNFENPANKKIVLFVGRLVYYKGVDYLIEAMKEIDALLLIAGDGPLREELEAKVKELKLENKIIFLGKLSDEEIKYCYQICNVFVLPSIEKTEAFGLVQLEAMLSGKPVVNTNLPTGVPFVSKDKETGFTVEPKNSKALAKAINEILNNPQLAEKLGRQGIERVNKLFSKEKNLAKILSIYNQLLYRHS
ncbi:MAG TPA: glycosyltransferase [Candidatus Pacearchaeota archaeon]|nr:glycosyltransferase [Candidatus Pacearchaeota archaeon]HOK94430.1 glycosyltransferase [Candidatus Pacearchaeota archaeon]HPO75486.1 glycosyltransferase [Candidatus Pacearchaeota archaeon]